MLYAFACSFHARQDLTTTLLSSWRCFWEHHPLLDRLNNQLLGGGGGRCLKPRGNNSRDLGTTVLKDDGCPPLPCPHQRRRAILCYLVMLFLNDSGSKPIATVEHQRKVRQPVFEMYAVLVFFSAAGFNQILIFWRGSGLITWLCMEESKIQWLCAVLWMLKDCMKL